eukprot:g5277.t1
MKSDVRTRDLPISQRPTDRPVVVGVGASAGGLEAISMLLKGVPENSGMSFVVIHRVDVPQQSSLVEVLSRRFALPVLQVEQDTQIEPDHVYVMPSGRRLSIEKQVLKPGPPPESGEEYLPIDDFLRSLAVDARQSAIGVLLSGVGSDGAAGLREIKHHGGLVVVQNPDEAEHPEMPQSAIDSVDADFVLPAERIGSQLKRYVYFQDARRTASSHAPDSREATLATSSDEPIGKEARHDSSHQAAAGIDDSDIAQAASALAIAKTRLDLSLAIADVAPWSWDMQTNNVEPNPTLNRLFGFDEDAKPGLADYLERIDAADRERVADAVERSTGQGETFDEEYAVCLPGGEKRHVRGRGSVRLSDTGELLDFFGVVVDITERKHHELELANREAHLRRVINNQLGLVGVIGRDGTLLEVDDDSVRIAGLTRSDVIGKHFAECAWWTYDEAVSRKMRESMEKAFAGEQVRYDIPLYAAGLDGPDARLMIDFMLAPVFDAKGEVEYLIPSGVDISERHVTEMALREKEQLLRMALRAGGIAAWEWTPEKSHWEPELYDLLGVSQNVEPSSEQFFKSVHPDDLPGLEEAWRKATDGNRDYNHEFRIIHPDGEVRWLVGTGIVSKDNDGRVNRIHGLNWDITEQKHREELIRDSERRFREMANAAPAMIWVTDQNHECTFLSQGWVEFTGQTEQAGLGTGWLNAIHPDDRAASSQTFQAAARQREAFEMDYRLRTAAGGYRWAIVAGKPRFDDHGGFLGYVGSVIDANDRHEAQEALKTAQKAAEAASESKSAFLANMSHEIRTPMTSILGYADLMTSLVDNEEALGHLQTIRRNGGFLLDIINDILDLSKIEADKLDIVAERFDPAVLIDEVRGIMEVRAAESNLKLEVNYESTIPAEIHSDPKRLRQILVNLVGNAVKFTNEGWVKINVSYADRLLRIEVADSGIGMSAAQRQRLFQPFSQGDHTVNREFGGTGLGLAISHRLTELLGGTIAVESEEGKGSTFTVTIGVGTIDDVELVEPKLVAKPIPDSSTVDHIRLDCHILVVDDRRDVRFLSRRILSKAGATVSEAEDGEQAVAAVTESMKAGTPYDMVILDMQMPKLDGYQTAKALRELGYSRPIIALTADAMQGDMTRCIESGCNDYLSKPIDKLELLTKIREYVDGTASHTPVSDGKNVYVMFGTTGAVAFDMTGKQLWKTEVGRGNNSRFGSAASPILYKDTLIVTAGNESTAIYGLNKKTGKQVWKATGDSLRGSYSTPVIAKNTNGDDQLLVSVTYEIWGLSPETGKLKWYAETRVDTAACTSIVTSGTIAYIVGGRGGGRTALTISGKKGDVTKDAVKWSTSGGSYVSSPVLYKGHLYWTHNGIARCVDAKTGKEVGRKRLRGDFYASIALVNDKLYAVSRYNGTYVLEASPELKQLAHNKFSDSSDFSGSPALESKLALALENSEATVAVHTGGNFWDVVGEPADLIVISHSRLPQPLAETMHAIGELPDAPAVIVIHDREDAEQRAGLLASGCYAVLHPDLTESTLRETLESFVSRRQQEIDEQLQIELDDREASLSDFNTKSPAMRSFMRLVRRVMHANSSLLILGETGVGKERLGRAIHDASPRSDGPFIPVNCAAFPESLLEGELFGYEKGAFTGATDDRRGYFELAHGGTLFLDEIGEVPRHVQVKLLRVLQERSIQRLGGEDQVEIDVRIMAATNRNLDQEIETGRFRRDLYYRLSVVTLEVPSLRQHPEDIPELLNRYLEEFRVSLRRNVDGFAPEAVRFLCNYAWPGNVRELINVVERAVLLCESDEITAADLPADVARDSVALDSAAPGSSRDQRPSWLPDAWIDMPWKQVRQSLLRGCERNYLTKHLAEAKGRIAETAQRTGLSTRSLHLMMKRLGLRKEDFRTPTDD